MLDVFDFLTPQCAHPLPQIKLDLITRLVTYYILRNLHWIIL